MKDKIFAIIEAIIAIALGIVVIVSGAGTALDIYFGIICLVGGIGLLSLACVGLIKTKILQLPATLLGSILVAVGISLFTPYLSFAALINLLITVILGAGAGLIIYGIYVLLVLKNLIIGLTQLIIGAAALVLAILYMTVPEFAQAFWIIIGILIIIYGLLLLVSAFLFKKEK